MSVAQYLILYFIAFIKIDEVNTFKRFPKKERYYMFGVLCAFYFFKYVHVNFCKNTPILINWICWTHLGGSPYYKFHQALQKWYVCQLACVIFFSNVL